MKRAIGFIALLGIGCALTGCQRFESDVTGISINEKNVVTQIIKEDFTASGYSEEELSSQIEYEINTYNDASGVKCIKSDKLKVKDGVAEIRLIYATPEDFASFNNEDFFVGGMYDAIKEGYTFQGSFNSVDTGSIKEEGIWGSKLMISGEDYKTVIISEPTTVKVSGNILYVSDNLKVLGSSTVESGSNELGYILYQ